MKLKNGEIYGMKEHLAELEKVDVPARVGYHVARLITKVGSACKEIEAARNKLITKYGDTNDTGLAKIIPSCTNWPVFVEEYNGLMEEETDIESNKVKLPGDTAISVKLLQVFEPFLEVAE